MDIAEGGAESDSHAVKGQRNGERAGFRRGDALGGVGVSRFGIGVDIEDEAEIEEGKLNSFRQVGVMSDQRFGDIVKQLGKSDQKQDGKADHCAGFGWHKRL